MRITTGRLRGRVITAPKSAKVRPMTDKVRGALFDVIGNISGNLVLDVYAGSGAVGIEALSRGARMVEAIEHDRLAAGRIEKTIKEFGLGFEYSLVVAAVESWLGWPANTTTISRYDLIVADPPYTQLKAEILDRLGEFLSPGGVMVVSHSSRLTPPELESLKLVRTNRYGDSSLSFYIH
ncbi:MAG TPA: 16S rRNA (guanine(966)-N(2))-methyltransferase RsmD [Candidatus Nanoarchaeia archaeon]|nr:16S rRNA (guanine(966)-N(2))-methyltransferase RsmD [Candidatus Nanoarchaeia archaeon]